jgi:hypothetical protein
MMKKLYLLVIKVEGKKASERKTAEIVGRAIGCGVYRKDINKVEQFFHIIDLCALESFVDSSKKSLREEL